MKKLKWIVLAFAGLVIIGLVGVWLNLNGIVRRTVETQTSSSLDLATTLGSANVSVMGGSLKLSNLEIASPPDFKAAHMLTLGSAGVNVKLGELTNDPVHVSQITIDQPKVVIEANGSKLNFQTLMDRPSTPTEPKTGKASEPIKVIIDELTVTGAQVLLRPGLSVPGLKDEYAITIPSVILKNVGTGDGAQNGVAIKEVVVELLTTLASKAAESDQLPGDLKNLLNLNVEAVTKQLGEQVTKQIDKVTKDLGKNLPGDLGKDAGKSVEKGIGDLLGGKKKDKNAPK